MKTIKKLLTLLVVIAMLFVSVNSIYAQTVETTDEGQGTITIQNASKGVKYTVKRVFDATYNTTTNTIAYTYNGTLAENNYFLQDLNTGAITVKDAAKDSSGNLNQDAAAWLNDNNNITGVTVLNNIENTDGAPLVIKNLKYGYYLVTSDQGNPSIISVDSTTPSAMMYDKNEKTINLSKSVNDTNVKIGQPVTYTVTWNGLNYIGSGSAAEKVTQYTITDTLPDFLSEVTVTSLKVGETNIINATGVTGVSSFGSEKTIVIPWVDSNGDSLYVNNSTITLVYTAVITDKVNVTSTGNTNTVTLTPKTTDDKQPLQDTETIYSYTFGLKKVNNDEDALADATFQLPFYVKRVGTSNTYNYAGTSVSEGAVNTVTTGSDGLIFIHGIATDETKNTETIKNTVFTITETIAPKGYNKLSSSFDVTATPERFETVTKYYDSDGKLVNEVTSSTKTETVSEPVSAFQFVINVAGAELPSTGGIGTTVFHIAGAVLAIGAAVLLISKKRMNNN